MAVESPPYPRHPRTGGLSLPPASAVLPSVPGWPEPWGRILSRPSGADRLPHPGRACGHGLGLLEALPWVTLGEAEAVGSGARTTERPAWVEIWDV